MALSATTLNPLVQIVADVVLVITLAWFLEYRLLTAIGAFWARRQQPSNGRKPQTP
jgi:hypothetical protein